MGYTTSSITDSTPTAFSSARSEWNTPPEIIQLTLRLFDGDIDLDPCSDAECRNIPSRFHYTERFDGLTKLWVGKVYMNPPYGRLITSWVRKFVDSYNVGFVTETSGWMTEGIALVPARTDTAWFRIMRDFPVCFVKGRLKFSGMHNSAPFPSAIFYAGQRTEQFAEIFGEIGDVYVRWQR